MNDKYDRQTKERLAEELKTSIFEILQKFEKDNPGLWISEISVYRKSGELSDIDIDVWE